MRRIRTLFIFGTRPEAIKLSPIVHLLRRRPEFDARVCVTAQHRQLLDQVLEAFQITPDHDLGVMASDQTLFQSTSRMVAALEPVLVLENPDMVVVQGDTTTTLCGALSAFYRGVPTGHVEAGLRTGDPRQPFPEEMNRVLTSRLAALHFAPTEGAAANLRAEGVPSERIAVTGNPGIDAIHYVRDALEQGRFSGVGLPRLDPDRKLVVVTAHRRESFGDGFARICAALASLAGRPDVQIVYPVHPNPNVRKIVYDRLAGIPHILLIDPLDYVPFVDLMRRAWVLLTDSGGIQEEGPSLGKPVLVLREKTERPEGVETGAARLVGTDVERIVGEVSRLLDDAGAHRRSSRVHNPYGDGRASGRIADTILSFFSG